MLSAIVTFLRAQSARMSVCAGLAVLLGMMAWSVTTLWAGGAATEAIKGTINEVIRILSDQGMKKPERTQERRKLLEKVVGDRFSYEEMAKRTLAAQWQKLEEKDRTEFVDLFKRLLTNSYADKVEGYSGEQIHYLNERLEGDYAEVRTKATSGKAEIPLDYRLLNKGGDWRVYDVVVDGVSLVSNYRGQFAKIIRTSGYDDLVKQLREKSDQFVKIKTATEKE
ncbi:MAG TPA: ABC transporter substrate-binding protein [Nitrospiraceae bacterium]|nr:ABC transporter substrate-binding protein [Nitrospiraceae bacterium]